MVIVSRACRLAMCLAATATVTVFVPNGAADAKKRVREWDKAMPCPTDAPVLVGSAGTATRFSALSECIDVRVVDQVRASEISDLTTDDYTIPQTQRDDGGKMVTGYSFANAADRPREGEGDVRVSGRVTETGVPVTTIAPARDAARVPAAGGGAGFTAPGTLTAPPSPLNMVSAPGDAEPLLRLRPARASAFDGEIAEVAVRQRIDPLLLHAVIKQESAYRPQIVSHAGAVGIMQIMPGTGRRLGLQPAHLRVSRANIEAGARELRRLSDRFGANFRLVLAAYNAGEGAVKKYGNQVPPYRETQDYVRTVLAEYSRLCAENGIQVAIGG